MAFYIKIIKLEENETSARYKFVSLPGDSWGVAEINKSSGEVQLITSPENDDKGHIFNRTAVKLRREWKGGHLPDITEWAS